MLSAEYSQTLPDHADYNGCIQAALLTASHWDKQAAL